MSDVDRDTVYGALDNERAYQDALGVMSGGKPHRHELESFALYMEDYLMQMRHELSREWCDDGKPPIRALHTLRKITALGVAAMEQHGAPFRQDGY